MKKDSVLFTNREKQVFELLEKGASNREISKKLNIAYETAKCHSKTVLQKLGLKSRKDIKSIHGVM